MEITRDIYLVGSGQIRLSNRLDCHVYLIDGGDELVLVDAGVGLETELILNNITKHGYKPQKLKYLLVTHCHADHAGGCKGIKEATSCKIVAPEYEDKMLEGGSDEELGLDTAKRSGVYPRDYAFPHCGIDRTVKDKEKVQVGSYELKVIQVPGHSKGSACFLLEQDGYTILFSSDIVFFGGTIGLLNCTGSSLEDYRNSIKKLADLSVDALLPGHYLWTLKNGQEHINKAIENLRQLWVPPAWQHGHPLR